MRRSGASFLIPHCSFLILFSSLILNCCYSQGKLQRFAQLSGPVKCWVVAHIWVAGRVFACSNRALVLADSMRVHPALDGDWNGGTVDAFRHGIWMALLVQRISVRKAERLGIAYEKGNYRQFRKGKLEDGAMADQASSEMDLWNNAQGRAIGMEIADRSEPGLIRQVVAGIGQGRFKVIAKDAAGNSLGCDGQIIPREEHQGKWENGRCLVPSR